MLGALYVDGEIDVPQVMHRQLPAPEIQFVDIGVGTPVITQRSVPKQSRRSPRRNIKSLTLSSMQTQAFHKVQKTQEVPFICPHRR